MTLHGYQRRAKLPESCPVCGVHPSRYQGHRDESEGWFHEIIFKCGCSVFMSEKQSRDPQVEVQCPESHRLAVQFKGELKQLHGRVEAAERAVKPPQEEQPGERGPSVPKLRTLKAEGGGGDEPSG